MKIRKLLVNSYERLTYQALTKIEEREDCRVFPKVGVKDIFEIGKSGISNAEYSYALKAHFDFVVCESDGGFRPLFAVEFDEPHHDTDERAIENDTLKAKLCNLWNFPLLRISGEHLAEVDSLPILCWIIDIWFRAEDFFEAQRLGQIPEDEIFIYSGILECWIRDEKGRWREYDSTKDNLVKLDSSCSNQVNEHIQVRPRDPFIAARSKLASLEHSCPEIQSRHIELRGKDNRGQDNAVVIIPIETGVLVEHVQCRAFNFPQVSSLDLTSDLAIVRALSSVREYLAGSKRAFPKSVAKSWQDRAATWSDF